MWNQLTNGPVELRAIEAESSRRGFGLQATFPRFRREWLTACSKSPALCTATGPASTGTAPEPPLREQRDVASTAHPVTLCSSPKGVEEDTKTPLAKWWGGLFLDRGALFLRCQSENNSVFLFQTSNIPRSEPRSMAKSRIYGRTERSCMDRGGDGIRPFPSGSVRRCVRTQAVRVRSLCSELSGRPGFP